MPFTGSHPAAVLPLLGTPLPASALVIGSIAPDLPYYLPRDPGWPTHTATGVLTVDLLLGLTAWALWHGLLAPPSLAAAPRGVRARATGRVALGLAPRLRSARCVLLTVAALVTGSATHVCWDEFTHADRLGTQHLAWLNNEHAGLVGYRWAQYASGVVGVLVLGVWAWHWWRRTPEREAAPTARIWRWIWTGLFATTAAVGIAAAANAESLRAAAFAGATRGGGTAVALTLAVAVVWRLQDRRIAI